MLLMRFFKDAAQRHLLVLLRISSLDEVGAMHPSLTDEQFDKWMATKPDFTPLTFGIDFKCGWAKNAYNRAARDYFVRHFLESVSGGSYKNPPIPSRYFTLDQVGLALDSHMEHARVRWRQQIKPPSADVAEQRRLGKQNNTRKATVRSTVSSIRYALTDTQQVICMARLDYISLRAQQARSAVPPVEARSHERR